MIIEKRIDKSMGVKSNYNRSIYQQYEETVEKLEKTETKLKKTEDTLEIVMGQLKDLEKRFDKKISIQKAEWEKEQKKWKKEQREWQEEREEWKQDRAKWKIEREIWKQEKASWEKERKQHIEEKKELESKLNIALEEIDRLKNQVNKNSKNSSKPSSTDIEAPKTSANQYNYRRKTNKPIGGQKGHKAHYLSKEKVEKLMQEKDVTVKEIEHQIYAKDKKDSIKYRIGININVEIEKHIFKHNEEATERMPQEFYTDVTYRNDIKAICLELNVCNVVACKRLKDFLSIITKGKIELSTGTIVNFLKEFSNKGKPIVKELEDDLLNKKILQTDDTSSKNSETKIFVRNYSNEDTVVYKHSKRKGKKQIKEHDILTRFVGGIVHDHETAIYNYGSAHYECIVHLGRYFEELIENVKEITWPKKMKKLLFDLKKKREKRKTAFTQEEICLYEAEYDEIVKLSKEENEQIQSTYYKEKAIPLSNRCKKYKENHLAFIKDFSIPFDNNLSERDLRMIKIKTKIAGCFRSIVGVESYCNAMSIIRTAKKRKMDIHSTILSVYDNKNIFA